MSLVAKLLEKEQLKYIPQEVTILYDECRRTIGRIFRQVLKHQTSSQNSTNLTQRELGSRRLMAGSLA